MSATIISPKQSLNQMKIKIPKAIAQHFPDVQGDNIDNNKEAKEKKLMDLKKKNLLKPRQDLKQKMKRKQFQIPLRVKYIINTWMQVKYQWWDILIIKAIILRA